MEPVARRLERALLARKHLRVALETVPFDEHRPYATQQGTHQVATDSEAVRTAVPVRALVARLVLPVAKNLVRLLLRLRRELLVDCAAVDQHRNV